MRSLNLLLVAVPIIGASEQACLEAGTCETSTSARNDEKTPSCSLYLAPSNYGGLGVYAGVDVEKGDIVGEPDVLIPMIDANKREWSLWHTVVWNADLFDHDMFLENTFNTDLIAPGIGSYGQCQMRFHSVRSADSGVHDSAGVHRKSDPTAGSFSYRYNFTHIATRPIQAGEEIFHDCVGSSHTNISPPEPATPEWLDENALCIDGLRPGMSTIPGAGRGAFAKRTYQMGDVVTHSPVIHMDRMETIISEQYVDEDQGDIVFSNEKKGTQLMLNYCFGDKDSNVLLLPTGPVVNLINHNSQAPNVAIRWSSSVLQPTDLFQSTASQALHTRKTLLLEYVALNEIGQGEEIFLDYGKDWQDAWSDHTKGWRPSDKDADYVYPAEFNSLNEGKDVRTVQEQQTEPYPSNLQTTCRYMQTDEDEVDSNGNVLWTEINDDCSHPCDIIYKEPSADPSEGTLYTAVMENEYPNGYSVPESCQFYDGGVTVKNIPRNKIFWTDKAYNSDLHLQAAFRHAIGVPENFFPPEWRVGFHESKTTVLHSPINPLELSPMVLEGGDGGPVTDYAFRIGLPPEVSDGLLAYCDEIGITELFRSLVVHGNPLQPGEDRDVDLKGQAWYVQRPDQEWKSNMHWISPKDGKSQWGYLQALGSSGFDKVLESIGEDFGLNGLVCYHLTFIGVSYSQKSYIHYDFKETGGKAFNVIIPLLLANETGPELDIQNADGSIDAGYRYEHNVASMLGDYTNHGTAAIDYRYSGEMRMAATVYIADVSPGNVDQILADYTQSYPPNDAGLLLSKAGSHWKAGDSSKRLPQPSDLDPEAHESLELATPELSPLEIAPILLGQVEYAFRIKLPDPLTSGLRAYCDRVGITEKFHSLVLGGNALAPGTDEYVELEGNDWYIQRPDKHWKSNMHWISPGGEDAQLSYLEALGENGFDEVLEAIGNHLGFDGLVCYHLTFVGVSYSQKSYIHHDFTRTGANAYNVIIPLLLANETPPELDIETDDASTVVGYRYQYGEASMIGDDAMHGTAAVDYRDAGEMRMAATVYIADVNPGSVDQILKDYTQKYPPKDAVMLLSNAGSHWRADNPSKRLPRPKGKDEL